MYQILPWYRYQLWNTVRICLLDTIDKRIETVYEQMRRDDDVIRQFQTAIENLMHAVEEKNAEIAIKVVLEDRLQHLIFITENETRTL